MAATLDLSPDELLSTTRSVRKRLDLDRPVEPELIRECIDLATQAPTGGNAQGWHFIVVTDAEKRAKLAEFYRTGWETFYGDRDAAIANMPQEDPVYLDTQKRVVDSADYLTQHLAEVPVHIIPCVDGRMENAPVFLHASIWGSLLPAVWNFCLGRACPWVGHVLDHAASGSRTGSRRTTWDPEQHHAGCADPGRPHQGHRFQAGCTPRPRSHRAHRRLVTDPPWLTRRCTTTVIRI